MSKRPYVYMKLAKHAGIYKHQSTGRYMARKKIKGKQYSFTCSSIRDAKHWKNTFDGTRCIEKNGNCSTLKEVWETMQRLHFPSLAPSTQSIWKRRYTLLETIQNYRMDQINPTLINEWITKWVSYYKSELWEVQGRGRSARCNLNNEINLFTTIFNWYKEEDEFEQESQDVKYPIRKRHKEMAFIKETKKKNTKISVNEVFVFFSALKPLYKDLALTQFYCAGRIGEIAGIQIKNIDLENRTLVIKETCRWCMTNKTYIGLNPFPKNKESRVVYLSDELLQIVERRLALKHPESDFLFHVEGTPLAYGTIQVNYRGAQRKTGIKYTGTHCLRHGMATLARQVGGSLDAVMSMTGHKDVKLADHYSRIDQDLQKETSIKIMNHIKSLKLNDDQNFDNVVQLHRSMT